MVEKYFEDNLEININNPQTIAFVSNINAQLYNVILVLVTLFFGALAGALVSPVFSRAEDVDGKKYFQVLEWFFQSISQGSGYISVLFLILIFVEIFILSIMTWYIRSKKIRSTSFDNLFNSMQVGEIAAEKIGEAYRGQLVASLGKMFEQSSVSRMYRGVNRFSVECRVKTFICIYILINLAIFLPRFLKFILYFINGESPVDVAGRILEFLIFLILFYITLQFFGKIERFYWNEKKEACKNLYCIQLKRKEYLQNILEGKRV